MKTDPRALDWGDGSMWNPTSRAWLFGLVRGAFESAACAMLEAAFACREFESLFRPLADGLDRMQQPLRPGHDGGEMTRVEDERDYRDQAGPAKVAKLSDAAAGELAPLEAGLRKALEADELLEWADSVKLNPEYGWLVYVLNGRICDIVAQRKPAPMLEGLFWAPTLREALSLAKDGREWHEYPEVRP